MITDLSPENSASASLVELYLAKRAELVRFFTRRTGSAQEGEDIVQEIYLRLTKAGAGEIANGTAWLYRIGSNLLLDRLRAHGRSSRREGQWVQARSTLAGGGDVADLPAAEGALDARRRLDALIEVVKTMPPQRRRVFELHKLEGLSHGEVAARLGISRSAVEKHAMAALRQLAERLR